jgi:hypothetical protein
LGRFGQENGLDPRSAHLRLVFTLDAAGGAIRLGGIPFGGITM